MFNKLLINFFILIIVSSASYGYTPKEQVIQFNRCVGCYLKRVSFVQLDLTNADLHNANLEYANFRSATLYKANLSGAKLTGAQFSGALWIDGVSICQEGSVGTCIKKEQ